MGQTSITAAALVIAFIIFVTVRGELKYYFGALGLGPMPEQAPAAAAGGVGSALNGVLGTVGKFTGGSDPGSGVPIIGGLLP